MHRQAPRRRLFRPADIPDVLKGGRRVKKDKKLTLSKETLRTLDERDLSLVVGGDSGSNEPPRGGPNSCPNTKAPGCK
jgi:hypothetical protein